MPRKIVSNTTKFIHEIFKGEIVLKILLNVPGVLTSYHISPQLFKYRGVHGGATGFGLLRVVGGVGFGAKVKGPGCIGLMKAAAPGIVAYACGERRRAR